MHATPVEASPAAGGSGPSGLLATRARRVVAFFALYLTMGLPFGFTSTALATQMRRANVSTTEIGALISLLYLPWAFKWVFGPIIDLIYSERLGRRRGWIVGLQVLMSATLLLAIPVDFTHTAKLFSLELRWPGSERVWFSFAPSLFMSIILLHNTFGAMQVVALDALACNALTEAERGTVSGFMLAGTYTGIGLGGAGVLYLSEFLGRFGVPFVYSYLLPVGCILLVTLLVSLRLGEVASAGPEPGGRRLHEVAARVTAYVRDAARALLGSRTALIALVVAFLPMGSQAFALGWRSTLAVELGMGDSAVASLALLAEVVSAGACVVGGYLSDRFGRRRTLVLYVAGLALPNLLLGHLLHHQGWSLLSSWPLGGAPAVRAAPTPGLLAAFWACNVGFSVFQGLYSGTRVALFMGLCTKEVAATQFSAYVSLNSLGNSVLAGLLGALVARLGYPGMLAIDAGLGLLCIGLIPFLKPVAKAP